MAELHGFARPMDLITEFDGNDEDVVPRQKPKYARQLAMEGEESRMPDPPARKQNERRLARFLRHNSNGYNLVEIVREVQVE